MLLGDMEDDTRMDSFLVMPIQRICKYPLLMKVSECVCVCMYVCVCVCTCVCVCVCAHVHLCAYAYIHLWMCFLYICDWILENSSKSHILISVYLSLPYEFSIIFHRTT